MCLTLPGKKYLALKPQEVDEHEILNEEPHVSRYVSTCDKSPLAYFANGTSSHILESRVSVSLTDDTYYSNGFDVWHSARFSE